LGAKSVELYKVNRSDASDRRITAQGVMKRGWRFRYGFGVTAEVPVTESDVPLA